MNITSHMYVNVKPVVTIVARMDLHAMGGATIRGGLLLHIMLYLGEVTIRGATKHRGRLFEEVRYTCSKHTCTVPPNLLLD